jgi:hypothetical protein
VGHVSGWINLPDVGERTLADFGQIADFGKVQDSREATNAFSIHKSVLCFFVAKVL